MFPRTAKLATAATSMTKKTMLAVARNPSAVTARAWRTATIGGLLVPVLVVRKPVRSPTLRSSDREFARSLKTSLQPIYDPKSECPKS